MTELTQPEATVDYSSDPEVVLLLEFGKGNRAAFETLLRKYYPRLFAFIYRLTGSRETAEDLAQETFLKVYQAARTYRPKAKFQTWVYTIAKNLSLNELRRKKRKVFSLDAMQATADGEISRQIADERASSPREDGERSELRSAVIQAVEALPEGQRVAVLLRRYDRQSYAEIAGVLGCSVSAVKSLLSRAKENLKVALAGFVQEQGSETY